jgi:hypothetical protein
MSAWPSGTDFSIGIGDAIPMRTETEFKGRREKGGVKDNKENYIDIASHFDNSVISLVSIRRRYADVG